LCDLTLSVSVVGHDSFPGISVCVLEAPGPQAPEGPNPGKHQVATSVSAGWDSRINFEGFNGLRLDLGYNFETPARRNGRSSAGRLFRDDKVGAR